MNFTTLLTITLCFGLIGGIARAQPGVTYTGTEGPGLGKRIVFLSGDEEYRSEE